MPALNFLPLATDAWIADTGHLSRAERGLYHDLLVLMWRSPECRVPNDLAWIARKLRCDECEAETLRSIIQEFCDSSGNYVTQKRLRTEWQRALERVEKQSVRAKARWNKEKDLCRGNAALHVSGNAPTPTPTPTYPKERDTDVSPKKRVRGSRLPEQWQPMPEALECELDPVVVAQQLDRFRDYWRSVPGAKGVKLDWQATWRNWLRKVLDDGNSRLRGNGKAGSCQYRRDAAWEFALNAFGMET